MKVAVIGGGVMGLATGWALKRRGHEPVVYEQFEVGNPHGSSHGRSRIFRLAYAEDHYVRLAQEALALWRELEGETGETLLELHGLVEIVSSLEESTAETLERCAVAWERLDREEAERRYPIRVPEGSFAVVQPEAGIARADKALDAFRRELDVREHTRANPDELDADAVVVTAGSWVNELLDEPLPVKVTRETVCYFRPEAGRPIPSVVSFKPSSYTHEMYSLYDPVYGLKVGAHHAGK
ncbi:MAG TPA: FAD-dependent oxidoreductase, partial [Gaiellaceae bacterium]|nr:FAD-dependent oxidoreductase [Gaiellaceae bacterium]